MRPGRRLVEAERDGDRHLHEEVDPQHDERFERHAAEDREDGCAQVAEDERDQRGHLEADVLGEVVVDAPTELDGLDDGGEVVVGQDHDRGFLGDLGAGDAHGHADVGLLQRRRVVDAVAGHGDDVLLFLEQVDEADLVLGRDARDHADVGQVAQQRLVAHGGELGAGERAAFDAQLASDRRRGDGVVAGDHAHLDAGALAFGDGDTRLGPRRVDDADHRQQREVVDQTEQVAAAVEGLRVEVAAGDHHDALAGLRHALVLVEREVAVLVGDRDALGVRHPDVGAARDEDVGRALDEAAHDRLALRVGHLVEGRHELVLGVERHFGDTREACAGVVDADRRPSRPAR